MDPKKAKEDNEKQVNVTFLEETVLKDNRMGTPQEERYKRGETYALDAQTAVKWVRRDKAKFKSKEDADVAANVTGFAARDTIFDDAHKGRLEELARRQRIADGQERPDLAMQVEGLSVEDRLKRLEEKFEAMERKEEGGKAAKTSGAGAVSHATR